MVLAGEFIDESDLNDRTMRYINKAGAESVTSSTTLQDDEDFAVTLTPGVWRVELILTATGATAGDIKVAWANTGTMTALARSCWGPQAGTTDVDNTAILSRAVTLTANVTYGLTAVAAAIREDVLIEVTATGILKVQWAQSASSGTSTTLSTSSRMYISQVEEWT